MTVERDGATVYRGETSTAEMVRTSEELTPYLRRHNTVLESAVLLTSTSLVPEEGFSLTAGDTVRFDVEDVGQLVNDVVAVWLSSVRPLAGAPPSPRGDGHVPQRAVQRDRYLPAGIV